jgi:hypothetical protein
MGELAWTFWLNFSGHYLRLTKWTSWSSWFSSLKTCKSKFSMKSICKSWLLGNFEFINNHRIVTGGDFFTNAPSCNYCSRVFLMRKHAFGCYLLKSYYGRAKDCQTCKISRPRPLKCGFLENSFHYECTFCQLKISKH